MIAAAHPAGEDVAEDDAADHRPHIGLPAAVAGLVLALPGLHVGIGQLLGLGGQHGGAKEAGFTQSVNSQADVDENLYAFAMHHFFDARRLIRSPRIEAKADEGLRRCQVSVSFPDGTEPQSNELHWSVNRHPDYSILMEFDAWQSIPLKKTGKGSYSAEVVLEGDVKRVDFISVHRHQEAGTTLTVSSHEMRLTR